MVMKEASALQAQPYASADLINGTKADSGEYALELRPRQSSRLLIKLSSVVRSIASAASVYLWRALRITVSIG